MAEYGREQRSQLSRAITNSEVGSRQLKGIVDNRIFSNVQMKNINTILQSAQEQTVIQKYKEGHVTYSERPCTRWVKGFNTGCFVTGNPPQMQGTTEFMGNGSVGHSEEQMIDSLYQSVSGKIVGKSNFADKQTVATSYASTGKKKQDIYTYLRPCDGIAFGANFNCKSLLSTVLTDDSTVWYKA